MQLVIDLKRMLLRHGEGGREERWDVLTRSKVKKRCKGSEVL